MVALSVSISASNSPLSTSSPMFLCHSATTPSVMVSLSLGMRMISAMSVVHKRVIRLHVDVFVEL